MDKNTQYSSWEKNIKTYSHYANKATTKLNKPLTWTFLVAASAFIMVQSFWPAQLLMISVLPFIVKESNTVDKEIKKSDWLQSLSEKREEEDILNG